MLYILKTKEDMKIQILPEQILENSASEEELLDQSTLESIYEIRRLKVALMFGNKTLEVSQTNSVNQVFIEELSIWIHSDEYTVVE